MDGKYSASSLFAIYTSLTAISTLTRQFYYQFVPQILRNYITSKITKWFNKPSSNNSFTLVINQIEEEDYKSYNLLYKACEVYLSEKIRSMATRLKGSHLSLDSPILYRLVQGEQFTETLGEGLKLDWKFICRNMKGEEDGSGRTKSFELSFDVGFKDAILDGHIPLDVVKFYEDMMRLKKDIYLFTYEQGNAHDYDVVWKPVKFKHPFTFDSLALDLKFKQAVINDLDKFIKRRELYKKVGKAWKRGYLLYGPPGTGKSSLVAAMANYLKFDIYDLQLGGVKNDSTLRKLMLSTMNKSILVIEDIDCTLGLSRTVSRDYDYDIEDEYHDDDDYQVPNGYQEQEFVKGNSNVDSEIVEYSYHHSLSGLLNFIDGLWSSCGDERIIIFTTNHKECLDPALLRPGRMDMHIHMSYLTMDGFKTLVNNYLDYSSGEHPSFMEIEQLLESTNVTPAQVAEELIRCEDLATPFSSVIRMLKKLKQNQVKKGTIKRSKKVSKGKK